MSGKRVLVLVTIASLGATAAIAIGVLLLGEFGEDEWRILGTTLAIGVCGLLGLPGAILLDQGRARALAWATVLLAGATFLAFEVAIWNEDSERAWKLVGTLAVAAAASAQISGLTIRLRGGDRNAGRLLYGGAVALALLIAALAIGAIWKEVESEAYYRGLAALAVLNVFLVVVQPLVRRLGAERGEEYRVRITGEPGGSEELALSGRDFADALARAVRKAERDGRRITRIERL